MSKNPLVFYIAENDHGDMSYSSLLYQIIQDCERKGLKIKVFSEFPNQTDKVETQELSNVPLFIHERTTEFLDKKMTPMGDLKARFNELLPKAWESYSDDLTPSELFEQQKHQIDNPETLELVENEIEDRKANEARFLVTGKREKGKGDAAGKEEGGDLYWFNRLRTALHFKEIHAEMAQDVRKGLVDGEADVVVMIAGTPHIPGLGAQLESDFRDCQKFVIGNFQERSQDPEEAFHTVGEISCSAVGAVVPFEFDQGSKKAIIPDEITNAINDKKKEKESAHASGEVAPNKAKEFRDEEGKNKEGSFVERLGLSEREPGFVKRIVESLERSKDKDNGRS